MAIKVHKPVTNGTRTLKTVDYSALSKTAPNKKLTRPLKKSGGRNNHGRITMGNRGGWHKRKARVIDWARKDKLGVPAQVKTVEYDPNRTAFISQLFYTDGDKRYIITPNGLQIGTTVLCDEKAPVQTGNRMKIKNIPLGYQLHEVEMTLGGKNFVRSAGSYATLASMEGNYAQVKLPSGEVRYVHKEGYATLGQVSNIDHANIRLGKAGRIRWLGRKPHVGGSYKNPVDHPHGGGEGHQSIGLRAPKTPWGKKALGVPTRKNKSTNIWVAKPRKNK